MSTLRRFGSSARLNALTTLDTSHLAKASTEHSAKRAEPSPQTSRSAPAERSKYQLWPAPDQRIHKPLPGAPEPAVVPSSNRNRSVRVHQSAEQMCPAYRQGDDRQPAPCKHSMKRTRTSPGDSRQPKLGTANVSSSACRKRRSRSAPGRTLQTATLISHEDVNRKYCETTSTLQHDPSEVNLKTGEGRGSLKRASSALLPAELNDLISPRLQATAFDTDRRKIEPSSVWPIRNASRGDSENETRPAVPPKTPPKKSLPTLSVSPLKLCTTKGPAFDKALPQVGAAETPVDESPTYQGDSKHVRDGSGDSVMDRGRPQKRSRSQARRGLTGHQDDSSIDLTGEMLPRGWPAESAHANLSRQEIKKLEHQSRSQAGRFEVLQVKDVKALSQQVRLLDEQCEYLRGFAKSLRRNRKILHTQTIAYLKSPALSEIPRQSMLQKVETLADLDDTIDEWAKKLERAEDQRLRARQRLLEHIAAVLVVPLAVDTKHVTNGEGLGREPTPPQSPECLKSPATTAGYDVESIRIYAGSEMHALLGVLDQYSVASRTAENLI